jgi:hypothetical protein
MFNNIDMLFNFSEYPISKNPDSYSSHLLWPSFKVSREDLHDGREFPVILPDADFFCKGASLPIFRYNYSKISGETGIS